MGLCHVMVCRRKQVWNVKVAMVGIIRWFGRSAILAVVVVAVVILAGSASSTSSPVGDAVAVAKCRDIIPAASEYGTVSGVLRGETSTAIAVANWQENRARKGQSSLFRALPSADTITVCLFSGDFVTPAGPMSRDGIAKTAPNTLRLLISNNQVVFDAAGDRSGMSPETPSDYKAANP